MILKLAGDWKMRAEYQTVMSTQAQRVLGLGSFGADLRYRVTRHALGGVNGELISPEVPLRSCRIGAADAVLSEELHDPVTSSDLRTLFLELFRDEMRLQDIEIPHSPKPLSPAGGCSQQP